jgi:hypothetical protein
MDSVRFTEPLLRNFQIKFRHVPENNIVTCIARHGQDKHLLALNNRTDVYISLLGNEILNELPWRQALGKQSVAKLRNNRTAVLRNPFLSNGSKTVTVNKQQYGKMCFLCGPCRGVILKTTWATQAGGVECLHRDPASRQVWDSKIWSQVPRDSDQGKTALARASSIYKRQTRPHVRESAPQKQDRNCPIVIA